MEYCSVVWHDNLTKAQSSVIERLQMVALKIILGSDCSRKEDGHFDYFQALTICKVYVIFSRREKQAIYFGKKCISHPTLKRLVPMNPTIVNDSHTVRNRELFHVNRTRTATYYNSAIPAIQRRLNKQSSYSPP